MRTPDTPLDHLARGLRSRASVPGNEDAPAAILWTDAKGEWRALLGAALPHIPELLVLGEYRPQDRTGPAIWLRCVVDRALDTDILAPDAIPILYLPGVERGDLRAGEGCPDHLKPLVELMYRGVLWHHPNGRDWTVAGFLGASAGPNLDIATDQGTAAALRGALDLVASTPIAQLRGRRLAAADFNRMAGVDVLRDVLHWMGKPELFRFRRDDNLWRAFRDECRSELEFDPEKDADVTAGARLGKGEGRWAEVWNRFSEAPGFFRGVDELLARSRPAGELPLHRDRWPDLNDDDEDLLRSALSELPGRDHTDACRKIAELERDHGHRRHWVWASLGRAPLAGALKHLARLADVANAAIGGATPDDVAQAYAERGWQADAAAREALVEVRPEQEETVVVAVRHLLEPWLEDSARAFQAAVDRQPLPSSGDQPPVTAGDDECIVFVDGLRYELGRRVAEELETRECRATAKHRWAAIPTVTATGKPAVTPVASEIAGEELGPDFRPALRGSDRRDADSRPTKSGSARPAGPQQLRDAMKEAGYQIVGSDTLDIPMSAEARGWLETGEIDRHGHHHSATSFARLIEDELARLVDRVVGLLDTGWSSVRIVTDHGWLLLPGGLPMVTLPKHLTRSKWARCAVLTPGSTPDAPLQHPWHWNPQERFATPSGIACFSKRDEYAHGGLSIQECLVPDIRVESVARATVSIRSISWIRFRCKIAVDARGGPFTADLRLGGPAGESVASSPKPVDADGLASLVLADDRHANVALVLVVTDADGRILAQRSTRTGEDA